MSNTVNNGIPFVPENTIDPAAGLNESLLTVDALLQLAVVSVGDNAPPGSPANGAQYIVGTAPTGAWAGRYNQVAQWLDGGWRFYQARYALNTADGLVYVRQGATWSAAAAEWTAETVSQAEAEAGTATTRRAWTAERVRQAILGWWNGATSVFGRGLVAAADAAAGRTALGLGTAAVASLGNLTSSTTTQLFGTSGLERVRIDSSGNLGVGTTAPAGRLSVAGSSSDAWSTGGNGGLALNGNTSSGVSTISTFLDNSALRIGCGVTQKTGLFISGQTAVGGSYVSISAGGAERVRVDAGGLTAHIVSYTLATLPSAAANPRLQVYCSNLTGQPAPVFSDGTNWRRVSDNTIAD